MSRMELYSQKTLALGLVLFAFAAQAGPIEIDAHLDGYLTCDESVFGNDVCLAGGSIGSLSLSADDPIWWKYDGKSTPDHDYIFDVSSGKFVDLILPEDRFTFSFFIGTSDYDIFSTGRSEISRNSVKPFQRGRGHFSSYAVESTTLPEPSTLALLGIGLLGLALTRRSQAKPPGR